MRPGSRSPSSPPAQPRYLQLLGGEGGAGSLGWLGLAVLLRGHSPLQRDPVACKKEAPHITGQELLCLPACNSCLAGDHTPDAVGHPQHPMLRAAAQRAEPAPLLRSCPGLLSHSGRHHRPEEFTIELRKTQQVGGRCGE